MTATPQEVEAEVLALWKDMWASGARMSIPDARIIATYLHERGWSRALPAAPVEPVEGRVLLDGEWWQATARSMEEGPRETTPASVAVNGGGHQTWSISVRPVAAAPAEGDGHE